MDGQARRRRPARRRAASRSRRARACSARSAQARMPAASSRPQQIVRSGRLEQGERPPDLGGRRRAARPTAPPPPPAARLRGRRSTLLKSAGERVDLLLPARRPPPMSPRSRSISARSSVHKPVDRGGRPGGQRVDQRRRLGRAPAGQQRLGRVGGQDAWRGTSLQAGPAGGVQGRAAPPRRRWRSWPVFSRASLSGTASRTRAAPSPAASASARAR